MLERPPGGAMIFWAVRLAMWSSAWDPAEKVGSGRGQGLHTGCIPKACRVHTHPHHRGPDALGWPWWVD